MTMPIFDTDAMLAEIRGWVEIESPTTVPAAVNRMVDHVEQSYGGTGAQIERIPGRDGFGDHLIARSPWGQANRGILILSHLDTVHPIGFIDRLPFRVEGDIAYGPGIYDMKAGAFMAFHAFREMGRLGTGGALPVTHLYVSEEEVGSPTSREIIEAEARNAKYVLVTEPAREGGKIVTARKGTARFELHVKGQPAHSGSRHQDGRSAVRELARQILAIEAFTDYDRGITTNVGVIGGGTRANVVPEDAYALIDMRVSTPAQADEMVAKVLALRVARGRHHGDDHRRPEPPALREGRAHHQPVRARQGPRRRDRLCARGPEDRRRLGRQFHRGARADARRSRRRRTRRAHPLRADPGLVHRTAIEAVLPAVRDAAVSAGAAPRADF